MPLYLIGTLLFGLGALIPAALFPVIQVDRLNLSYTAAGLLGFVQSLFWFFGYLFGGKLLDKLGGIRCLQIVFVIQAIVILPYIWATDGWMLLPSFIAVGLVTAGADLASLYAIIELAGPKRVPAYTAISSTVAGLRGLIGPFLGSVLVTIGWPYWAVFWLSAALTLAGAGVLFFIKKVNTSQWAVE
jgi:MFS family permease